MDKPIIHGILLVCSYDMALSHLINRSYYSYLLNRLQIKANLV